MTKYNAKKTEVNGITFDSKLEADRYEQLLWLERAGEISDLMLQVEFQITRGYKNAVNGEKIRSRLYIADFVYWDRKIMRWVAEDTKGIETPEFKFKWDLVRTQYPVYEFRKVTRDMV